MLIQVYNTLIRSDQIIGVGDLFRIRKHDAAAIAYNEFEFRFDVYTVSYVIAVTTNALSFTGNKLHISQAERERITAAWGALRDALLSESPFETIAELQPKPVVPPIDPQPGSTDKL